jgi:hypothetical protein
MGNDVTPVAARMDEPALEQPALDQVELDAASLETDANLRLQVTGATKAFHRWQQVPAWLLGFAAIALGFVMVWRGYDSAAGWFAVSTAIVLAVVASFRSPFSFGETSVSTAPSSRRKAQPPAG